MAQTLGEMVTEATVVTGRTTPEARNVAKASITRRYKEIANVRDWDAFHREITATVTAGRSTVGLPYHVDSIDSVWNVTAGCPVEPYHPKRMESLFGSDMATSGTLSGYFIAGVRGSILPTTGVATPVTVASTSTQDNVTVVVEGSDENGLPFSITAVVNGTNQIPVTYPSDVSGPLDIESFSKGSTTQGKIVLSEPSLLSVLSVIGAKARDARYTWLRFNAVAGTATSLRVQANIPPDELVADEDIPLIRGCEPVLVRGAIADIYRFLQSYQKARSEEQMFQILKEELMTKAALSDPPGQIVPLNYRQWEV